MLRPVPREPTVSPLAEREADERDLAFDPAFLPEAFFAELFFRPALFAFAIHFPFVIDFKTKSLFCNS